MSANSTNQVSARGRVRRLRSSQFIYPVVAAVVAALGAVVLLLVDSWLPQRLWPAWLSFPANSGRSFLATVAGGMITAAAVVFWIRATMAQMAASQFSARVLNRYVDDRFGQAVYAYLIGTFAYLVVVLLAMPSPDPGQSVPVARLSVLVGLGLSLGVLFTIVLVIRNSARTTQIGEVLQVLGARTLDAVRTNHPEQDGPGPDEAEARTPDRSGHVIRACQGGWVNFIDEMALMATLPPNATVRVESPTGMLVTVNERMATVWTDDQRAVDADLEQAIREALNVGSWETNEQSVLLGIRHMVDVAVATLQGSSSDQTASLEVLQHLRAILREILLHGQPTAVREGEDGRLLLLPHTRTPQGFVHEAMHPVREAARASPTYSIAMLQALASLRDDLLAADHTDHIAVLDEHVGLVMQALEAGDALPADKERVRRRAHALELDV